MEEEDLIKILEKLTDKEFKNFKWYLKRVDWNKMEPIKVTQLEKAEREDTVDLIMQKYESSGALQVLKIVLKKIQRNDLVRNLQSNTAEVRDREPLLKNVPDEDIVGKTNTLMSVRTKFIQCVSDAVLDQLLDRLLDKKVLNEGEIESVKLKKRADKAREIFDMVKRKGDEASAILMKGIKDLDSFFYKELDN